VATWCSERSEHSVQSIHSVHSVALCVASALCDLVGTFSSSCLWKHLIHFLQRNSNFCQPYWILSDVAAIFSALLCRIYSFVMGSLRPKKSVTTHESHCCSLIHDQRRDVAFGGRLPNVVGSWCTKPWDWGGCLVHCALSVQSRLQHHYPHNRVSQNGYTKKKVKLLYTVVIAPSMPCWLLVVPEYSWQCRTSQHPWAICIDTAVLWHLLLFVYLYCKVYCAQCHVWCF